MVQGVNIFGPTLDGLTTTIKKVNEEDSESFEKKQQRGQLLSKLSNPRTWRANPRV